MENASCSFPYYSRRIREIAIAKPEEYGTLVEKRLRKVK
jgi:hypothetical protein